ncbi:hypothetical protein SAMN05216284_11876 [Micromonospora sediminimaris]|nr:hypothetical protein SAMN05216284_11876 [Micromonospora sediminimaris]
MSVLDVLRGSSPGRRWTGGLLDGTKIEYITPHS